MIGGDDLRATRNSIAIVAQHRSQYRHGIQPGTHRRLSEGQAAARAGKTRKDCPYKEPAFMAGGRGLKITSHAFRDKWLAGFNSIKGKT